MRMEVIENGRAIPKELHSVVLIAASDRMRERHERESQIRAMARRPARDELASVRFAMRAVEQRIVRGLWVLEISQSTDGPQRQRQHGIAYLPEHLDRYGTIASGGEWSVVQPCPPVPSNREIDAAKDAQGWISWLDDEHARLLNYAAITKRGERQARIKWNRVKTRLRLPDDYSIRTLQDRYDRCLRFIVAELTLSKVA